MLSAAAARPGTDPGREARTATRSGSSSDPKDRPSPHGSIGQRLDGDVDLVEFETVGDETTDFEDTGALSGEELRDISIWRAGPAETPDESLLVNEQVAGVEFESV